MNCIQKLAKTWKAISKKHIAIVKEIDNLFDSRGNFKVYRGKIRSLEPPFLPFEGILLTDLTYVFMSHLSPTY